MENVEFHNSPDGTVYYKVEGKEEKRLTRFSREILLPLLKRVRENFPEAYAHLQSLYRAKAKTPAARDQQVYVMLERFIRCNFGEHDLLTEDIDHDILNFEEVKCPLRGGYCQEENVICKPKGLIRLSPAERDVVKLYLEGLTFDVIAGLLGKSPATVKAQLYHVKKRLHLRNCREIIKTFRFHNC
jgi:DNA-binding CsgD family transcriptional regulator